jgi:hypothetical protein
MGTYAEPSEAEEAIEAMGTTFGLERNPRLLCAPTLNSLSKDYFATARLASPNSPPAGGTVGAVAG